MHSKSTVPPHHVREWIFDLDNTLYPRRADLFSQIDWKMTAYVERLTGLEREAARAYQKELYREHGTTLAGLMQRHAIDPHHYLAEVHDIDYAAITPDPALAQAIGGLPGRKHIFTNGDVAHAERTLAALGFEPVFDRTFDIVAAGFEPKPARLAYDRFLSACAVDPLNAAMFEDMPRNLEVPKAIGMLTVLVVPGDGVQVGAEAWEHAGASDPHIDHVTSDLSGLLSAWIAHG